MDYPDKLHQFIPQSFLYLTQTKKITHKEQILKTDYLINLIHELILKFYFTNDIKFDLWSILLRKKYGK
jgi:hypothetical protein